jgi:hypothetical protein
MITHLNLPIETRGAPLQSVNDQARSFEVVFTTGAAVDRLDPWTGERYREELIVSENAIRMDRLNAGAPFLDSHMIYSGVSAQLGVVERAWVEKGRGLALIRFPSEGVDEAADRVFRKIAEGIFRSVSVGYRRNRIEVDKKKDPPIWRVVDWEPFEVSLVSVPADAASQVRDGKGDAHPCHVDIRGLERPDLAARLRRARLTA